MIKRTLMSLPLLVLPMQQEVKEDGQDNGNEEEEVQIVIKFAHLNQLQQLNVNACTNIFVLSSFTLDVTTRHTVWSLVFGGFVYWLKSNAVSQNMIQRYLSLPTLAAARQ